MRFGLWPLALPLFVILYCIYSTHESVLPAAYKVSLLSRSRQSGGVSDERSGEQRFAGNRNGSAVVGKAPVAQPWGATGEFCVWFNFTVPLMDVDAISDVSLCTHGSAGYSKFIFDHAAHWKDAISLALLIDGAGFTALAAYKKLHHCTPSMAERVATHLVWRISADTPCSLEFVLEGIAGAAEDNLTDSCDLEAHWHLFDHNLTAPYPPNTLRNVARSGAPSDVQLVADIENQFPDTADDVLALFVDTVRFDRTAVVVRRFEFNESVEAPRSPVELQQLVDKQMAFPFHHFYYAVGHQSPFLQEWFNYSVQEWSHGPPKLDYIVYQGNTWEPQLLVHRSHPLHFEGIPIRFRDQQALPHELCRDRYQFAVASHVFSVHKGIKKEAKPSESTAREAARDSADKANQDFEEYLKQKYPSTKTLCGDWTTLYAGPVLPTWQHP